MEKTVKFKIQRRLSLAPWSASSGVEQTSGLLDSASRRIFPSSFNSQRNQDEDHLNAQPSDPKSESDPHWRFYYD
jgi:hypothetical protein